MTAPIPVRVTRYRCPHCARSHSSRIRAVQHMDRCWYNPAAKGCKTCVFFVADFDDYGSDCMAGVDLTGHPACEGCGGYGVADTNVGGEKPCGPEVSVSHIGDGRAAKPGPITGCAKWSPLPSADAPSPALPTERS